VYSKSANLNGLFQTLPDLKKDKRIILLEGYNGCRYDAAERNKRRGLPRWGTSYYGAAGKINRKIAEDIIFFFDADDAGRTATQRALEIFAENEHNFRTVSFAGRIDPDEYHSEHGKISFDDLINKKIKIGDRFYDRTELRF
jgi:DNA primase